MNIESHAARPVALVVHLFVNSAFDLASAPLDRPLDVVVGHVRRLGLLDCGCQCRVELDVASAFASSDLDGLGELAEQLAPLRVLSALAVLDIRPFGMTCHDYPSAIASSI